LIPDVAVISEYDLERRTAPLWQRNEKEFHMEIAGDNIDEPIWYRNLPTERRYSDSMKRVVVLRPYDKCVWSEKPCKRNGK